MAETAPSLQMYCRVKNSPPALSYGRARRQKLEGRQKKTRILRQGLIANIRHLESGVRNIYWFEEMFDGPFSNISRSLSWFLVTLQMIECSFFDPSSMNILAFCILNPETDLCVLTRKPWKILTSPSLFHCSCY